MMSIYPRTPRHDRHQPFPTRFFGVMMPLFRLTSASTTKQAWEISTSWIRAPGWISTTRRISAPDSIKIRERPTDTQQSTSWSIWRPRGGRESLLIPIGTRASKLTLTPISAVTDITLLPDMTLAPPSLATVTPSCTMDDPSSGAASLIRRLRCTQWRRSTSLYPNYCRMRSRWCNCWEKSMETVLIHCQPHLKYTVKH